MHECISHKYIHLRSTCQIKFFLKKTPSREPQPYSETMGKDSNLDNTPIYEASDHRKTSRKDQGVEHRYDEGTKNSHKATDSSMWSSTSRNNYCSRIKLKYTEDQRSIANRLGAAELLNRSHRDDTSGHWSMPDPRAPVYIPPSLPPSLRR